MSKHTHTKTCEWRAKGAGSNGARYCLSARREREKIVAGPKTPEAPPRAPRGRLRSSKEGNCSGSTAHVPKFHSNPQQIIGRRRP